MCLYTVLFFVEIHSILAILSLSLNNVRKGIENVYQCDLCLSYVKNKEVKTMVYLSELAWNVLHSYTKNYSKLHSPIFFKKSIFKIVKKKSIFIPNIVQMIKHLHTLDVNIVVLLSQCLVLLRYISLKKTFFKRKTKYNSRKGSH